MTIEKQKMCWRILQIKIKRKSTHRKRKKYYTPHHQRKNVLYKTCHFQYSKVTYPQPVRTQLQISQIVFFLTSHVQVEKQQLHTFTCILQPVTTLNKIHTHITHSQVVCQDHYLLSYFPVPLDIGYPPSYFHKTKLTEHMADQHSIMKQIWNKLMFKEYP